ncbi:MAG: sigma-70 family RNA polymerase sigma factor [Magnetococcales bacterium]|nr:sigma-70 family RNA polymerase sigma factor [Magnetococcales bacterium]
MIRFTLLQVRDRALAEDVVQEAMSAALSGQKGFSGKATLKTWVFGILRHKIIDSLRHNQREISFSDLSREGEALDEQIDTLFKNNGHWNEQQRPTNWDDPEQSLHQQQFWAIFHACLGHLPKNTAQIFTMREFLDLDIEEICAQLGVTTNNCYVTLYRARMKLRICLEQNWFTGEPL